MKLRNMLRSWVQMEKLTVNHLAWNKNPNIIIVMSLLEKTVIMEIHKEKMSVIFSANRRYLV